VREVRDLADELPRFTPQERDLLHQQVAGVALGGMAELAIVSLIRDFTLCERSPGRDKTQLSGTKPSRGLCAGCHYFNNPEVCCWQVDQGLSDRARQDLRDFTRAVSFVAGLQNTPQVEVLRAVAPYVIWHRTAPNRSLMERPPYYGARKLAFISDLVERSINRTVNERGEMNLIFSRAVDGEIPAREAIRELSGYDDPIACLDYIPALERMA